MLQLEYMHAVVANLTLGFGFNYYVSECAQTNLTIIFVQINNSGTSWYQVGDYSHDRWRFYWLLYPYGFQNIKLGCIEKSQKNLITGAELDFNLKEQDMTLLSHFQWKFAK